MKPGPEAHRPQSAMQRAATAGPHVAFAASPSFRGSALSAAAAAAAADSSQTSAMGAVGALMAAKEPPVILRELLPLPTCDVDTIKSKILGTRELLANLETFRLQQTLKEIQNEWESAVGEAAEKEALKKAKTAGAGGGASVGGGSGNANKPPEVPLEGQLWLLLMNGITAMVDGKYALAQRSFIAGE